MSTSHPLPPKKEVALALLERSSVHVHLDPRGESVHVPVGFKKQPQLVLQIGLNMPVPIPDLRLDDDGMTCTLSFNRSPYYCVIPWSCVFAMVGDDGRGMVWPDDVPPEIATQAQARQTEQPAKRPPPKRPAPAAASGAPVALAEVDDKPAAAKAKKTRPRKSRAPANEGDPALRPMLVAVPAQPEKRPTRVAGEKKRAPADRPRAGRPSPASTGTPKPKRELPPYLRVVK